jgi:hypothetical protein
VSFFCPDIWWLNLKFSPVIYVLLLATLPITCSNLCIHCFQLPFYFQSIIGSESENPHFQDRNALTQTILINNCCFSLTSKFFGYPVILTHCLWWSLIWTRAWHLWLSRVIFITGSYCFDTSGPKIKYCLFAVAGRPTHLKCTWCKNFVFSYINMISFYHSFFFRFWNL